MFHEFWAILLALTVVSSNARLGLRSPYAVGQENAISRWFSRVSDRECRPSLCRCSPRWNDRASAPGAQIRRPGSRNLCWVARLAGRSVRVKATSTGRFACFRWGSCPPRCPIGFSFVSVDLELAGKRHGDLRSWPRRRKWQSRRMLERFVAAVQPGLAITQYPPARVSMMVLLSASRPFFEPSKRQAESKRLHPCAKCPCRAVGYESWPWY